MEVKAVVFDFDGVLVTHSEFLKEGAWADIVSRHEGIGPNFIKANDHFGFGKPGDRFDILRMMFEEYGLTGGVLEETIAKEAEFFNNFVQEGIVKEGLAEGVVYTLESLTKMSLPLYVNSGTATDPLRESLQTLGVDRYFSLAVGGPASKGENMKMIADIESVETCELLLVGDSSADEIGAHESGCQLVGIANDWNKWRPEDKDFPVVCSLREVVEMLKEN